jgi:hypothetical protein
MTFIIAGNQAGRWVTSNELEDKEALIEKLTFSSDGKHLLALVRVQCDELMQSEALIYSTEDFPKDALERRHNPKPTKPTAEKIPLECLQSYRLNAVVFGISVRSPMIAICTSYVESIARIQLLRKMESGWDLWGPLHSVSVFPSGDQTQWHGLGLTGISLYLSYFEMLIKAVMKTNIWRYQWIQTTTAPLTVFKLSHLTMEKPAILNPLEGFLHLTE